MEENNVIPVLSLLVAISALVLNNSLAMQREKRKEFKARMDDVLKLINDVEEIAVKLHTANSYDDELADEIKWKINRLSMLLQSIRFFKNPSVSARFVEFKRSIMLNNFNSSKFTKQTRSSLIVRGIHGNSTKLSEKMLNIYDSRNKL